MWEHTKLDMGSVVYIVDDDRALLEGMEIALAESDYEPVGFLRPATFWKTIKKKKPDAVVLDIGLQGENGDSIAKKLKNTKKFENMPVILISADEGIAAKALKAQADWYLSKPFAIEKLVHVLDESLSSRSEYPNPRIE